MPAWKVAILLAVVLIVGFTVTMLFFPDLRPEPVQKWFYPPATSAEDALDRFKKALEKRDFRAAARYCSGDFGNYLSKYHADAKTLAKSVDDLRYAMKANGVKSDKADFILFLMDPFPPDFEFKAGKDGATLSWAKEVEKHKMQNTGDYSRELYKSFHMIMPRVILGNTSLLTVSVKEEDGSWKIGFPTSSGDRSVTTQFEHLRKNATNFRNALNGLGQDVKNNPTTKENFERDLKQKLEESK